MPNSVTAKIKSVLKIVRPRLVIVAAVAVVAAVILCAYYVHSRNRHQKPYDGQTYTLRVQKKGDIDVMESARRNFYLKTAYTAEAKAQGLSNTPPLMPEQGMIFVYDEQNKQCFWMKDMRYALDIIWVDSKKTVTAVEYSVQPDSYPTSFCHSGQYVIELSAGEAKAGTIGVGDLLSF